MSELPKTSRGHPPNFNCELNLPGRRRISCRWGLCRRITTGFFANWKQNSPLGRCMIDFLHWDVGLIDCFRYFLLFKNCKNSSDNPTNPKYTNKTSRFTQVCCHINQDTCVALYLIGIGPLHPPPPPPPSPKSTTGRKIPVGITKVTSRWHHYCCYILNVTSLFFHANVSFLATCSFCTYLSRLSMLASFWWSSWPLWSNWSIKADDTAYHNLQVVKSDPSKWHNLFCNLWDWAAR